jgi:prefoldin subunit 5
VLPTPAPGQEADVLKRQAESLQGQLDAIRARLDDLSAAAAKD